MDESREYSGVTATALECLKADMRSKGIKTPEGSSGKIEHMGVSLSVDYLEAELKLVVRILGKPPFIPEQMVWGFLDPVVKGCTGK